MNELNKITRVIRRELPEADIETLMVLDATTGQNGLIEAKQFLDTADLTGIVLTKLDGTAKGGIVFAIANDLQLPVKMSVLASRSTICSSSSPRNLWRRCCHDPCKQQRT